MNPYLLIAAVLVCSGLPTLAQEPEHPPVDQELPDEELLRLVRLDYPGLEDFAAAMQANDLKRAQQLLVKHFATREKPYVPEAKFPGVSEGNSMVRLRRVSKEYADDKILKHIFSYSNNDKGVVETYQLDPAIKWIENPSECFTWNLYLNQLNMLPQLAYIYRETGDEKYAVEAGEMVTSWVKQMWRGYCYVRDGKIVNSGMEVRNRLCNCLAAYEVVRKSASLTPEMHMAFWKLFVSHARDLMTYSGVSYPGLIPAAVMLPEFSEAGEWLAVGEKNIHNSLVERTTPEGGWDTHSVSYQMVSVPWSARSLEFLQANPESGDYTELAEMIKVQTGKLMRIMLWLAMPNGGLPNIGDTYGRADWGNATLSILSSYIHSQLAPDQQERVNAIKDPFERMKAALAVYEGHAGAEPQATCLAFPGTGYYVMRSSWEPQQARYLYFDLSPQALGHAHYDACHFDLYAYGKPLLCDTGDYFLGWGYRTALHNNVEVDEKMSRWGAEVMPCEWLSTDRFDFADGAHAGFPDIDVIQRRKILFVKGSPQGFTDYWVLCDLLNGTGSHKYEQFFHFAGPRQEEGATAEIEPQTLAAFSTHQATANVQIIPAYTAGLQGGFVTAQETEMLKKDCMTREAMLGWIVTTGTFHRAKSAAAVYTREGEAPVSFHDVLFPVPNGAQAQVRVTALPVSEGDRELPPTVAAGLQIECSLTRRTHDPDAIVIERGENLAAGMTAFGDISQTGFAAGSEKLLTDGKLGVTVIGEAMASAPYTPDTPLSGHFGLDFGKPVEVNTIVLHHGTFNGSGIIYPPTTMTVEYWDGEQWQEVANAETSWEPNTTTNTFFETVTTTRLRAVIERPAGGRLAMREVQAYRVSAAEIARVEALRAEITTSNWTDYFLISHAGPGMRRYGEFSCDGELALLRHDANGGLVQASLKSGSLLGQGDQLIFSAPQPVDYLTARWEADTVAVECASSEGLQLLAQEAREVLRGEEAGLAAAYQDGVLTVGGGPALAAPKITKATVRLEPPQAGLHGAQPWAVVTWQTDRPATTQVEFSTDDGLVRRTVLDPKLVTDHSARVEFLRPDKDYTFAAISVDGSGARARQTAAIQESAD